MDRNISLKYSELLRFSNITCILSYYSYLDQWKRVMTCLSTSARRNWMEFENAFINFGRSLKRDFCIEDKAASSIQRLVSDRQLFNMLLLKRDTFQLYLRDILMKLNPKQELILHLFAENTNYFVLHFCEDNESSLILPSIECPAHNSKPAIINQPQMTDLMKYLNDNIDLNAVVISRINKTLKMKIVLSPLIKVNYLTENEILFENSKFNKLYPKRNCICCVNTLICEYDEVDDANDFWNSFCFNNSVERIIYNIQNLLSISDLDECDPLNNLQLQQIEFKIHNLSNNYILKDKESTLCVYLRPCQFTVKTKTGCYLVESTSSKIVIAGDNNCKLQSKSCNWFLFKSHFIEGENFKVMLNFNELDKDVEKALNIFMTNKDDKYALVKISDIYKVELKELYSTQYFAGFPCLTELEITIDECNITKESTMRRLNAIPRNLNLKIHIDMCAEWILYDSEFWDFADEFHSFRIYLAIKNDNTTTQDLNFDPESFEMKFLFLFNKDMTFENKSKLLNRIISMIEFT